MISASRAYQACRDLFDAYPLAVNAVHHIPTMHSMVLMLRDSADARFFVLLRDCGDSRPAYSLIRLYCRFRDRSLSMMPGVSV